LIIKMKYWFLYLVLCLIILLLIFFIPRFIKDSNNKRQRELAKKLIKKESNINVPIVEDKKFYKRVMQTYKSKDGIPEYVFDNIKAKSKGWEYYFYDDQQARQFLLDHFGQIFVDKFDSFSYGAHKADLFRICWLYQMGGVYIDLDVELIADLDQIIENKNYDFMLPLSDDISNKRLLNALIISDKGSDKIKKCIEKIMNLDNKELKDNYLLILYTMQEALGKNFDYQLEERNKSKLYPLIPLKSKWKIFKNNKAIAKSKYDNYNNGKFD